MPRRNAILNGGFDLWDTHWSGVDLEIYSTEGNYFGNGSQNRDAEMDGYAGAVTVMQQSFSVSGPAAKALTFRLGGAVAKPSEPRVEIVDALGQPLFSQDIYPTTVGGFTDYSPPVSFPSAGTHTLRLTELAEDDSMGAVLHDVSIMVCFADGTLLDTSDGLRVTPYRAGERTLDRTPAADPVRRPGDARAVTVCPVCLVSRSGIRAAATVINPAGSFTLGRAGFALTNRAISL